MFISISICRFSSWPVCRYSILSMALHIHFGDSTVQLTLSCWWLLGPITAPQNDSAAGRSWTKVCANCLSFIIIFLAFTAHISPFERTCRVGLAKRVESVFLFQLVLLLLALDCDPLSKPGHSSFPISHFTIHISLLGANSNKCIFAALGQVFVFVAESECAQWYVCGHVYLPPCIIWWRKESCFLGLLGFHSQHVFPA